MRFVVTDDIFETFPDVRIGVVVARGITTLSGVRVDLSDVLVTAQETVRTALAGTNVIDHPRIRCWREAYRSFGAKLKKYPSSIENLVRRTLKREPIRPILPLVDIYNAVSLEHLLPVGGEDLDSIEGDLRLTRASESEPPVRLLGEAEERAGRGAQGRGAFRYPRKRCHAFVRESRTIAHQIAIGRDRAQVEKVSRRSAAPKEPWRSRIVIFLV